MRFASVGLMAVLLIGGCERPSGDPAVLAAIAAEAASLKAAHPTRRGGVTMVPASRWPSTIASLKPERVHVSGDSVEITTRLGFDGGWGYGIADRREDLSMMPDCWRRLPIRSTGILPVKRACGSQPNKDAAGQ